MDVALTFDRTGDLSKLEGTNTRGIEYRWDIFSKRLANMKPGNALDFGAGSLRESYDLVSRGFEVTSIDLDLSTMSAYQQRYSWPAGAKHRMIADADMFAALKPLGQFSVVTCFDVLEHLEDPRSALQLIAEHMTQDGILLVSVPNGRTLFELAWRIDLKIARATGRYLRPGEPHLQRLSPAKWRAVIRDAGLRIVDHEMHIGFFANTTNALVQLPLALGARILRKAGVNLDGVAASEKIIQVTAPTMDRLDRATRFLSPLYGWNLFVIARA